jgi:large subunit ribosomal protein L35
LFARERLPVQPANGSYRRSWIVPKLKTNRAAAKRFRKTAKGFKRYSANRRHNLGHKDRKVKRHARSGGSSLVHESDVGRVTQLLPHHK